MFKLYKNENSTWSQETQEYFENHSADLGLRTPLYGGEAMVFFSEIDKRKVAIRVQCFDPWLFTTSSNMHRNFKYRINASQSK